jgi:DNA-directed RNA polymerase specialized sigma24 family protein
MRSAFDLVSKILVEHPFYAAQLLQMELMKSYHESYKNEIQEKLEEVDKFIQQRQKVIFSFMSVLNEIDKEIVRLITLNGWGSQKLAGELHMDLATVDSNVLQIFDKFRAHFELEHADTNTLSTILGPYWGKADKIS